MYRLQREQKKGVELPQGSSCHIKGRVVTRVELSCGLSFFVGQVVMRVELSRGSSCHEGRVVTRVELSRGSSCHKGRVVTRVELSVSSCLMTTGTHEFVYADVMLVPVRLPPLTILHIFCQSIHSHYMSTRNVSRTQSQFNS